MTDFIYRAISRLLRTDAIDNLIAMHVRSQHARF